MPIAAAIPALIGVAGSVGGALIGSSSSNKAASQAAGANAAASTAIGTATNQAMAQENQVLSPYINAGTNGVNLFNQAVAPGGDLTKQFSFDPTKIADNPNYQFVLAQGTKAVQQSAAAQGGLFSGGTMKALDQYSQGLATQTVNDAYAQAANTFQMNRNNQFQDLSTLTQVGQTGTAQLGGALGNFLQGQESAAHAFQGVGEAQAAGTAGAGAAWSNALQGITGYAQQAVNPNPYYNMGPTPGDRTAPVTGNNQIDQQYAAGF